MIYKYDPHVHTCQGSACGKSTGAQTARAYKKYGYSGIVITDHFFNGNCAVPRDLPWEERVELFCKGYEDAKAEGDRIGLHVFFGFEWNDNHMEVLVYGLDKSFLLKYPQMLGWSMPQFITTAQKEGALVIQAHPYRVVDYIPLEDMVTYEKYVDGVEVQNIGNALPECDEKALALAIRCNLLQTAGSDEHNVENMRLGGMGFDHELFTPKDFIDAVRSRKWERIHA